MANESTSSPHRTILHVDMDAFYVSVELLHHPELIGKPVVVGGSPQSRGVVCSASYEARAFGIHSGMGCFQAYKLCPHAVFLSNGFGHYAAYSQRIKSIFQEFTPLVEMASQDEAYLDLTGTERLFGSPLRLAQQLRNRVLEETKLPCSIGIGRNKLIAKIASGLCKPKGLLWVPFGAEEEFLSPLPLSKIPGVGTELDKVLRSHGLIRIGDALNARLEGYPPVLARRLYEIQQRCRCRVESPVRSHREIKSISHERTFDRDVADREALENYLHWLAEKVSSRLRAKERTARTIGIKLKYTDFQVRSAECTLGSPTDDPLAIAQTALRLLREKWEPGEPLRLIGLCASGLDEDDAQLELFPGEELDAPSVQGTNVPPASLHQAMDCIRGKHGFEAIHLARSTPPRKSTTQ
ncbi:MAG: DNA polymerase IV [Candidatus Sumerlaeia bacterium]|nr:DNA polymerase IV [Candidatus Sumerlaeia bacterium]